MIYLTNYHLKNNSNASVLFTSIQAILHISILNFQNYISNNNNHMSSTAETPYNDEVKYITVVPYVHSHYKIR